MGTPIVSRSDRAEAFLTCREDGGQQANGEPLGSLKRTCCIPLTTRNLWYRFFMSDTPKRGTYDLELDCLSVDVNGTDLKVDSYRAEVALRVGVLGEPQEQARLGTKTLSFFYERRWLVERTFPTPESPMRRSLKR